MKKNKIVDYFQFNLYRLKNSVNSTTQIDEIYLIIFNNIIDSFPDDSWFAIKDTYFRNIDLKDTNWLVIYTIIAYKMGPTFTNANPIFIEDLVNNIIDYKVSFFKLTSYAEFFLQENVLKTITYALDTKGIPPKYIIKLVLENFDLSFISPEFKARIYADIEQFVSEFSFQIFNGNYNFFNIYRCLKKIWDNYLILELTDLNFKDIELLLSFNELPSEEMKEKAQHDFAEIEKKDASISEKFADSLTIIIHYSYELPKYSPSKSLKYN